MKESKKSNKKNTAEKKNETVHEKAPFAGIWSGTISFSLVAIPVRLVKAVDPGRISFHMLHNKDYSPLERKMICPEEGIIVPPEEIIRGYEIEPGRHITVSEEELESVSPERSRTIEITEFIKLNEVDPIYYDHPYFLVPLKGGEKAYRLFAEAMQKTNKAGIAKFVLDEREYVVIIKSREGALGASTMHYKDEIHPENETVRGKAKFTDEEKNSIKKTINEMMTDFAPEKYANKRREKLLEILKMKIEKKKEVLAPEKEEETNIESMVDLMESLMESMHKIKKTG